MLVHAGQGYAGHGTLCGSLGVSSYVINMVCYDDQQSYSTIIDRMMYWYSGMNFPTERFDDISAFPKQVQTQAMTPLCHTSVSKWTPLENIAHCIQCHGPETFPDYTDGMNQQQGHMECLLCHTDHTK